MNRRAFLVRSSLLAAAGFAPAHRLLAQAAPAGPVAASPNPAPAAAAPTATVTFTPLRGGVGYATGRGGTLGWLANAEALVAVDAQFPDTARLFIDGLPGRGGRLFDHLINTHHHGDHTAGNGVFRPVAKSILAHAAVPELQRSRSKTQEKEVVADTTFTDLWRRDLGSETVTARHFGPAHTKGDIAVYFEKANVVHVGDLVFNRLYPVIDRPGGASIAGWIGVLETMVKTYPADATYIFGHGSARFGVSGTVADLGTMRDVLTALLEHTGREIKAGKPREEIVKLQELPGFPDHAPAAGASSRLPADLGVAYDELTAGR
ncbi:MAG: MBL fold metallo-hydrolase [Opitutaceae bacterium]|nr:MBL fold metallo-hydrolase [Opitutaceae bacterium]